MSQNTSTAVMVRRVEPHDSLDDFPTPPWATRALLEHLETSPALWDFRRYTVWEPACNRGHMARVLHERFGRVHATDVHDYSEDKDAVDERWWPPGQSAVCDFLLPWVAPQVIQARGVDWIITNPPFRLAAEFALRALSVAGSGVALFTRTAFLEGGERHRSLFQPRPPDLVLQFCERVVLHKGRLAPKGSTATAYCWIVWIYPFQAKRTEFAWIAPCRKRLEREWDYASEVAAE